jgi:hypothetical protein
VGIVLCLLDCASKNSGERRGTIAGFDAEACAASLEIDAGQVAAVLGALRTRGTTKEAWLDGDRITSWSERQPKREDLTNRERQARYRQHQKDRKRAETEGNADKRGLTPREEETRGEKTKRDQNLNRIIQVDSSEKRPTNKDQNAAAGPTSDKWERRQRGSTPEQIASSAKANGRSHFVIKNSEPWRAWQQYRREVDGFETMPVTVAEVKGRVRDGWWFSSLYPPATTPQRNSGTGSSLNGDRTAR